MNELMRRLLLLPEQGSTYAKSIDELHYFVITTTMLGATAVAIAAVVFVVLYKTRGGPKPTRRIETPLWAEVGVVGFLASLFVLWWVIGFRQYVQMTVPPRGATEIYVVAKQWVWKFDYPTGRSSVETLYVPTGRPVKLLMTSRDVIHSFFVPAFRVKQDVIPARYTSVWFEAPRPGRYDVYCAEYCGAGHSRMRGEVVVLDPEDYDAWTRGRTPEAAAGHDELARVGERVAARMGCIQCHSVNGTRGVGPTWVDLFGREEALADGRRVLVDGAYITESMMEPNDKVVAGFAPVMPSYRGAIEPGDTAAIVEFMKSISRFGAPDLARGPEESGR